jgi:hypothetical protein
MRAINQYAVKIPTTTPLRDLGDLSTFKSVVDNESEIAEEMSEAAMKGQSITPEQAMAQSRQEVLEAHLKQIPLEQYEQQEHDALRHYRF